MDTNVTRIFMFSHNYVHIDSMVICTEMAKQAAAAK